jgi:transposase
MIGLDTAKSVFQVHGVNKTGKTELKRKLGEHENVWGFHAASA